MKDARGHGSNGAAHQTLVNSIRGELSRFLHHEGGEGRMPGLHDTISEIAKEPSTLIHLGHFLGVMAALAVVDILAYAVGLI
jgi:hypothetical protein